MPRRNPSPPPSPSRPGRPAAAPAPTDWPRVAAQAAVALGVGLLGYGAFRALSGASAARAAAGAVTGTVFTIVMENKGYSRVVGSASAPYFNALAARYALCTNYRTPYHPSLPNYLVMTSGQTWGVADDAYHLIDSGGADVFAQMGDSGVPWRAYAESMGTACRTSDGATYASRHNPAVYYASVVSDPAWCGGHVVDLSQLWTDLAADADGTALRYAWITPNLIDDMHDGTIAQGDAWLAQVVPQIMASAGYRNGGAIFILFDEVEGGNDRTLVPALVVSERLARPGQPDGTAYDHRSYLAAVQDILGIGRLPSTAGATSMAGLFAP